MRRLTPPRSVAAGTAAVMAVCLALLAAPAYGDGPISLPEPGAARAQELALVCNKVVGGTPERCKKSSAPGPVVNDEKVLVGLGGDGIPVRVQLEQRLVLTKVGDYVIRERGPARSAVGLVPDSDPPNTKLGAVVYQGFTPGNRRLGARLTLDAGLEAPRLPLGVTVRYDGGHGPRALDPGGRIPGPGTVQVRLTNNTAQPAVLPTGSDVDAASVAPALDAALRAARAPAGPRLPSTDTVLPKQLDVAGPARSETTQSVPLRIAGSVRITGTTGSVSGDGASPVANGAVVAGTLSAELHTVQVTAQADGPGFLDLDLSAVPALDPRVLAPPRGFATWAAWARSHPPQPERRAALDLLVTTAATGARASSYSPYLGADLPGSGTTVFSYAFAPADAVATPHTRLHPRPGPIALAAVALLLLLVNGGLIWRQS